MITIGILFSYMIGYFASGKNWFMVALFIFPVCFSICQIILFTKFFYEDTPTFLLMKNRKKSVISMISRIYYGRDADDSNESFEDKLVTGIMPVSYSSLLRSWTSDSAFRNGCILAGLQQLSGVNYFIVTSASIFPKDQKRITLLLGIVNCISSIFTVLLLKKNYKKNLMYGSFGMAFCYFSILGLLLFENNTVFIYGYFVTALGFTLFFELSIGPILWIYCADILGTKGIAITSSINWICASFIIGVFGLLGANGEVKYHVNEGFSKQISFFCYNLFTLLVCLTVKFYVDCLLCQV